MLLNPLTSAVVAADVMVAAQGNPDALEVRRRRRLASLLASACRRSAVYRERLAGCDPQRVRLQDLPVMRKADLMRRFDDWVTDPRIRLGALRRFMSSRSRIAEPFLGRYVVWESSGSSGEPGVFVQDMTAMAVYDALEALRRPLLRPVERMFDPWYLGERLAFVGAVEGHFASNVSLTRLRQLNPAMSQRLHLVSFMQPMPQLLARLNALAPTIIATYPSAAVLLAEERAAGRLEVSPREVWTGGETLSPAMRRFVSESLGCAVVNSYGTSEFLTLACECHCGRMHLNSDWAILESVDRHGHEVPQDEPGATTLLTNLANQVQPLIRYDLGDRITIRSRPCECGSHLPVIDVQGRSDDTLRFGLPHGRNLSVLPLALSTVLEDEAGLFDFQLVQEGPNDLMLSTPRDGAEGHDAVHRAGRVLSAFLRRQGAQHVHVHCYSGRSNMQGRSGKIQRVMALQHAGSSCPGAVVS
jgi:phenylacetate-coenzyme A ligase PaaK-like adenylate-forming protein